MVPEGGHLVWPNGIPIPIPFTDWVFHFRLTYERLWFAFCQILRMAPLMVPVTMNSILTGDDIANAMDLRCFGQGPCTWLTKLQYHWWDYALIVFSVLLWVTAMVTVFWFDVGGFRVPDWWLRLAGV